MLRRDSALGRPKGKRGSKPGLKPPSDVENQHPSRHIQKETAERRSDAISKVPKSIREKAWARMRRGGQKNLFANIPKIGENQEQQTDKQENEIKKSPESAAPLRVRQGSASSHGSEQSDNKQQSITHNATPIMDIHTPHDVILSPTSISGSLKLNSEHESIQQSESPLWSQENNSSNSFNSQNGANTSGSIMVVSSNSLTPSSEASSISHEGEQPKEICISKNNTYINSSGEVLDDTMLQAEMRRVQYRLGLSQKPSTQPTTIFPSEASTAGTEDKRRAMYLQSTEPDDLGKSVSATPTGEEYSYSPAQVSSILTPAHSHVQQMLSNNADGNDANDSGYLELNNLETLLLHLGLMDPTRRHILAQEFMRQQRHSDNDGRITKPQFLKTVRNGDFDRWLVRAQQCIDELSGKLGQSEEIKQSECLDSRQSPIVSPAMRYSVSSKTPTCSSPLYLDLLPSSENMNTALSRPQEEVLRALYAKVQHTGVFSAENISAALVAFLRKQKRRSLRQTEKVVESTDEESSCERIAKCILECSFPAKLSWNQFCQLFKEFVTPDGLGAAMNGFCASAALSLFQERYTLLQDKSMLRQTADHERQRASELNVQFLETKKEYESRHKNILRDLQANADAAHEQLEDFQNKLEQEKKKSQSQASMIHDLKSDIARLTATTESLQAELEEKSSTHIQLQAEKDLLEAGLSVVTGDCDRLSQANNDLESKCRQQQRSIEELLQEKDSLEQVNASFRDANNQLETDIKFLRDELSMLQRSVMESKQDILDENEQLNHTISNLQDQLNRSLMSQFESKAENSDLDSQRFNSDIGLSPAMKSTIAIQTETNDTSSPIESKENSLRLADENTLLRQEVSALLQELQLKDQDILYLQNENEKISLQCKSLSRDANEIEDLKSIINTIQKEFQKTKSNLVSDLKAAKSSARSGHVTNEGFE
eukprot:m.188494 g.188494  ORF g.188494 m.188494 type:complete len:943 (+) comp15617_c0_seq3:82-2910(+)